MRAGLARTQPNCMCKHVRACLTAYMAQKQRHQDQTQQETYVYEIKETYACGKRDTKARHNKSRQHGRARQDTWATRGTRHTRPPAIQDTQETWWTWKMPDSMLFNRFTAPRNLYRAHFWPSIFFLVHFCIVTSRSTCKLVHVRQCQSCLAPRPCCVWCASCARPADLPRLRQLGKPYPL